MEGSMARPPDHECPPSHSCPWKLDPQHVSHNLLQTMTVSYANRPIAWPGPLLDSLTLLIYIKSSTSTLSSNPYPFTHVFPECSSYASTDWFGDTVVQTPWSDICRASRCYSFGKKQRLLMIGWSSIRNGYCRLNLARIYKNQPGFGAALKKAIPSVVKCEDILSSLPSFGTLHIVLR